MSRLSTAMTLVASHLGYARGMLAFSLMLSCADRSIAPDDQEPAPTDPPSVEVPSTSGSTADTAITPTLPLAPLDRGADLDGDGYDDLAVSAPYRAGGGVIRIYAGGPTLDDLPEADLTGDLPTALLGTSLDLAGDLDGDGRAERGRRPRRGRRLPVQPGVWFPRRRGREDGVETISSA